MSGTREQIIETTCGLLENQGYYATGINEIVKSSGAPRGSIYYFFPDGKEQITAEAVLFAAHTLAQRIEAHLATGGDLAGAVQSFVENIAHHVEASGFQSGGPLTIVASESATTSERLNLTCREAYTLLIDAFKAKLLVGGVEQARAGRLALMITAAVEGGIILSRTYHSGDPLREVAAELACMLRI